MRNILTRTRSLARFLTARIPRRGQSMVEFALVLPLTLLVFLGVFESARLMVEYVSIANAAREGARAAVITSNTDAQVRTAARNVAITVGATPVVQIAPTSTRVTGTPVTVTVSHTFVPLGYVINVAGIPISNSAVMIPEVSPIRARGREVTC